MVSSWLLPAVLRFLFMDAGVPLKRPCFGVVMGSYPGESGKTVVLTDIQGLEDFGMDLQGLRVPPWVYRNADGQGNCLVLPEDSGRSALSGPRGCMPFWNKMLEQISASSY